MKDASPPTAAVDFYWVPLGAGQHVVRLSGKVFEAITARLQGRRPCNLYHSALVVVVPEGRFVIEQRPIPDIRVTSGVVFERTMANSYEVLAGTRANALVRRCHRSNLMTVIPRPRSCLPGQTRAPSPASCKGGPLSA
jgi:hypothetical protein